jgi:NitT/TauT family transport system permease protein
MTRDLARWPLRLASLLACLLFWQLAARHKLDLLLLTFTYVPTPGAVLDAAWQLLASNTLLAHLGSSLARVFAGYGVAALGGEPGPVDRPFEVGWRTR